MTCKARATGSVKHAATTTHTTVKPGGAKGDLDLTSCGRDGSINGGEQDLSHSCKSP